MTQPERKRALKAIDDRLTGVLYRIGTMILEFVVEMMADLRKIGKEEKE